MPVNVRAATPSCKITVSNIKDTSVQLNWDCSEGKVNTFTIYKSDSNGNLNGSISINSCQLYLKGNACVITLNEKKGSWNVTGLTKGNYYMASFSTNSSEEESKVVNSSVFQARNQSVTMTATNKNYSTTTKSNGNSGSGGSNSGNSFDPVHNSHDSAQDATANSFLCKEDELNKESEEYKNSLSYLIDKYWAWVFVLIPIALLIFISLDFLKAFFSGKSDDMKKASSNAIKRVIAALLLMLTPVIVKAVFGIFGLTFCF